jgi:hypothetical protein
VLGPVLIFIEATETEKRTTKQSLEKFSVVPALSVVSIVSADPKINRSRNPTYLSLSATFVQKFL